MTHLLVMFAMAIAQPSGEGKGPPPTPVRAAAVVVEPLQEQRMVTGTLRSVHQAKVASQDEGLIVEILVREGAPVRAGDVLARLDVTRLDLEIVESESAIAAAEALVQERLAQRDWAASELESIEQSLRGGAATAKERRDRQAELRIAEARLLQARRAVESDRAALARLTDIHNDAQIVAPFDGQVVAMHTEVGEWIGQGDAIVELLSTNPVEAWLNVPQRFLRPLLEYDGQVTVRIEASDELLQSVSRRIISRVDLASRSFTLIATLDNPESTLAPGMSVVAWAPTEQTRPRITIPKDALLRNDIGHYVYLIVPGKDNAPSTVRPANVELLFPLGDRYVIQDGPLKAGDRVVVEGNERLFPTAPVREVDPVELQGASADRELTK